MKPVFALLTSLILLAPLSAANWPQWRGPNNDGISTETNLPTVWNDTQNVAWSLKLPGMGSSTPVVWGDRLFLTCEEGDKLVAMCVDTAGKELWKKTMGKNSGKSYRNDEGNDASPSPSTDGKMVYCFVGSGDFVAYDFEGNEQWRFNAQERYGKFNIQFGIHNTPVLYGDVIYFQLIHSGGAHVVAIEKATGKEIWHVDRKSDGRAECEHSYASPVIWSNGESSYLITHGNDYAIAHNLKDGSEIWRVGELNLKKKYNPTLRFVTSPLATPELIIIPSAKNGPVVAVRPDAKGMILPGTAGEVWRRPDNTPDVPSPLIKDGILYLLRENGRLIAMDVKTGEEIYNERTHDQRHRSCPVYADGRLYLAARDGTFTVVKAGAKFELVARNKLSDQFTASPAIADGTIYLRGFKTLFAIRAAK